MKKIFFYPLFILLLFTSCYQTKELSSESEDKDTIHQVLKCESVKSFIEMTLQDSPKKPSAYIDKFLYKGQYVFFLEEGGETYPDKMYTSINADCEVVCRSGGIAGFVCEDFDKAEFVERIWKDER